MVMSGFILLWQLIVLFLVFKLDESYTPSKVSIRAGDGFHNLKVNFYFIGLGLIGMIMLNYLVLTLGTFLGD